MSLKLHWVTCGIKEGRRASSIFNIEEYKKQLNYRFGDNNYAYVAYYNTWGFLGPSDVQTASKVKLILPKGYELKEQQDNTLTKPMHKPVATPTPTPKATPTPTPEVSERELFNAVTYADRYPDLKEAFGYDPEALWEHYDTIGRYEGRIAY